MDDETVLRAVFDRYDTESSDCLRLQQFILLVAKLGKYVPELKGVEFSVAQSAFTLFDRDGDKCLSFNEFKDWWLSEDRYSYFSGEKAKLLRKAYILYTRYTRGETLMTLPEFSKMMESLGIRYKESDFDILDRNEDGVIDFNEFCRWLNWF